MTDRRAISKFDEGVEGQDVRVLVAKPGSPFFWGFVAAFGAGMVGYSIAAGGSEIAALDWGLVVFLLALVCLALYQGFRKVVTTIDRAGNVATREWIIFGHRRQKTWDIGVFSAIHLIENHSEADYVYEILLFGPETAGLPRLQRDLLAKDKLMVLRTADRQEADAVMTDLSAFLSLPTVVEKVGAI